MAKAIRRDRNDDVRVLANELDDPFQALTTTKAALQDARHCRIVALLLVLDLGVLQHALGNLQSCDDRRTVRQRAAVIHQAAIRTFHDSATFHIAFAMLILLGMVILCNGVGDRELIKGRHKLEHPDSDDDVQDQIPFLCTREVVTPVRADAGDLGGGPQIDEANEKDAHDECLRDGLQQWREHHRWHLPNHLRPGLHCCSGQLHLAVATAHQARHRQGDGPRKDGECLGILLHIGDVHVLDVLRDLGGGLGPQVDAEADQHRDGQPERQPY
mmetsp:Transcript_25284/g.76005  ORF Transcript_25284/g.76005 Transcript_25284/m.76005 type:complete len:272 (-) Transcript_25284:7-822(-)